MVSTTLLLPVLVVTIAFIIVSVTIRGKGQHIVRYKFFLLNNDEFILRPRRFRILIRGEGYLLS